MRTIYTLAFLFISLPLMAQWTQHIVTSNARGPLQIVVGDIDNDGYIDVLNVNNYPAQNFVWYKNIDGTGSFNPGNEIGVLYEPRNMAIGDIDGDNDLDVLGTSPYTVTPNVVSFKNLDGLGDFGIRKAISTPNTQGERAILVRDIDGDGHNDLVIGSIDDDALTWYKNLDGNGTFDTGNIIISNYVNGSGMDVGDIDGDGDLDIVAGTLNYNTMSWFENLDGRGIFGPPMEIGSPGMAVLSVFLADIDGDGDLDVVGSEFENGGLYWWENLDGLGNFSLERIIEPSLFISWIYPVDLDNDNDIDVLALAPGFLRWYENLDGMGNFGTANIIKDDLNSSMAVSAADIDNDGDMDPIAASQSDDTIYWFENMTIIGVNENQTKTPNIYPNPTRGLIFIDSKTENVISATILDIVGEKILRVAGNIQQLDISNLQSGMYFLKLTTDSGEQVKKIVKE